MKLVLTGPGRIETRRSAMPEPVAGMTRLKVNYCGVCRTDAKMWHEGHRDLVLPRVLGHEIMAEDETGRRYAVWPGNACGDCRYCASGRENLCESMQIIGFHLDGGFSDYLLAPATSLIPVSPDIASHLVCFAEPVGCVLNALDKLSLKPTDRLLIFGGGTMGLIAALAAKAMGTSPLVIEKNAQKIARAAAFLKATEITCLRETLHGGFDAAINACADCLAFGQGLAKLAKNGRLAFFSGLTKNRQIETNLINVMHYKETQVFGAYGLTRIHMARALDLIGDHPASFDRLVAGMAAPRQLAEILPDVLAGGSFRYILDISGGTRAAAATGRP